MDEDTIGTDDFLGFVEIPIQAIVESKTDITDKWYKLKSQSVSRFITPRKFQSLKILIINTSR